MTIALVGKINRAWFIIAAKYLLFLLFTLSFSGWEIRRTLGPTTSASDALEMQLERIWIVENLVKQSSDAMFCFSQYFMYRSVEVNVVG